MQRRLLDSNAAVNDEYGLASISRVTPRLFMHRFFIEPERSRGMQIELSEREVHHAATVLRLREGDRVAALDGAGSQMLCLVEKIGRRSIILRVTERSSVSRLPYELTLVQALPKGKTMEMIVQKATELGAARVVPILAERTVTHLDEESAETKVQKWNWIAIDAIKQCGNPWLPRISSPVTPGRFLAEEECAELNLLATFQTDAKQARVHLRDFLSESGKKPKSVSVWVGPEGDFTPGEIEAIRSAGALPITLGPLVLRSDTAAFYCLSVLSYELQSENC
jgi:16S rRNA (uracil1498-N3)-methyltransferase